MCEKLIKNRSCKNIKKKSKKNIIIIIILWEELGVKVIFNYFINNFFLFLDYNGVKLELESSGDSI